MLLQSATLRRYAPGLFMRPGLIQGAGRAASGSGGYTTINNIPPGSPDPNQGAPPSSIKERLRLFFKQYGKLGVGVYLSISAITFGSSYLALSSGVDVHGLLIRLGVPEAEWMQSAGTFAFSYAIYKLLLPARLFLTAGLTSFIARRLRLGGDGLCPGGSRALMTESTTDAEPEVWMLGRRYPVVDPAFVKEVRKIIWCTYRTGFEAINGAGLTSDSGWGCMIRTGQMVVAEGLQRSGRTFSDIVRLVADSNGAPLSLHKVSNVGASLGKDIGQWHTPSVTAQSLHRLLGMEKGIGMGSVMAQDLQLDKNSLTTALSTSPCIIWLPMRLGVTAFNPIYVPLVKKLLRSPLTLGLGGGRPRSSYYFFGFSGDDLMYLDPHFSRPVASDDEESLMTYEGDCAKKMPITAIDPCLVAAFLLKDLEDLRVFESFLEDLTDPMGSRLVVLTEDEPELRLTECADDSDFMELS